MGNGNPSKLDRWRAKYGAIVIALTCLLSLINGWGNSWILTAILGLGVLVCGTIGVFDIKLAMNEKR